MFSEPGKKAVAKRDPSQTITFDITNTIGISMIDATPMELIQISLMNVKFIYKVDNNYFNEVNDHDNDDGNEDQTLLKDVNPNQNSIILVQKTQV